MILAAIVFLTLSCHKTEETIKTFTGPLPIVATNSPTTVFAGQNIIAIVRCQLSSLSGSVSFQGFNIRQTSANEFAIAANALYKDWNTQIAMPVMWTLDTIASIRPVFPGQYILRFYNSNQLFKSDTVRVI